MRARFLRVLRNGDQTCHSLTLSGRRQNVSIAFCNKNETWVHSQLLSHLECEEETEMQGRCGDVYPFKNMAFVWS